MPSWPWQITCALGQHLHQQTFPESWRLKRKETVPRLRWLRRELTRFFPFPAGLLIGFPEEPFLLVVQIEQGYAEIRSSLRVQLWLRRHRPHLKTLRSVCYWSRHN